MTIAITVGIIALGITIELADQIDRGADGGEVQPLGGTDIAPQVSPRCSATPKGQRRQPLRLPHRIEMGHAVAGTAPWDCP
jgi:hypothetical protein